MQDCTHTSHLWTSATARTPRLRLWGSTQRTPLSQPWRDRTNQTCCIWGLPGTAHNSPGLQVHGRAAADCSSLKLVHPRSHHSPIHPPTHRCQCSACSPGMQLHNRRCTPACPRGSDCPGTGRHLCGRFARAGRQRAIIDAGSDKGTAAAHALARKQQAALPCSTKQITLRSASPLVPAACRSGGAAGLGDAAPSSDTEMGGPEGRGADLAPDVSALSLV